MSSCARGPASFSSRSGSTRSGGLRSVNFAQNELGDRGHTADCHQTVSGTSAGRRDMAAPISGVQARIDRGNGDGSRPLELPRGEASLGVAARSAVTHEQDSHPVHTGRAFQRGGRALDERAEIEARPQRPWHGRVARLAGCGENEGARAPALNHPARNRAKVAIATAEPKVRPARLVGAVQEHHER